MTTVLKLGGELLEDADAVRSAAQAIVRLWASTSLVVVHGGVAVPAKWVGGVCTRECPGERW